VVCRLCGHDRKLVKAHIIPEGFFRKLWHGKDMPFLLSDNEDIYPKRAPIGVYDREILCEACELLFARWDQYGQEFLERRHAWRLLRDHDNPVGYEVLDYDYANLKLFFVSVLWRASVSRHPFFKNIDLGSFEDIAKQQIIEMAPGNADDFSVILAAFNAPTVKPSLDPALATWTDVRHYQFYLGDCVAYIKADERKTPEPFHDLVLKETPPFLVISRDLRASPELSLMKKIAQVHAGFGRRGHPA